MASKRESHPDHEEGKIPIFTVQKMVEIFQDIANCLCLDSLFPISFPVESVNSSMPEEAVLDIAGKESQSPQSLVAGCPEMKTCVEAMEKNSSFGNSKAATSPPQIQTIKSKIKSVAGADNKVDICSKKDLVNKKSISRDRSSVLDGEEEIFTPDKENFSPNTLKMRFLKNKDKLEVFTPDKENLSPNTLQMRVLKNEESRRSHNSKANCAPNIRPDESISPASNKENQTPKVVLEKPARRPFGSWTKLEQKQGTMALKNRVERVPFESLLMNSGGKSRSDRSEISGHVSAVKSITADDCGQILDKHTNPSNMNRERKRNWDMIVDTASLLDRDSRKALQLLQGRKGTRLIIPRMVIKKLDSMKHQFSIFRRRSEASLALEWIEECVTKTKWWIHIQSTMEEGMLITPTPPASTQTQFSKDSWTFPYGDGISQTLSSCKRSEEIVSPTADDHILDFALLHRRKQTDGQLVLLSDDVTLKVKSMAEGLLCETVQEFRESLVNPFSERFLWANSSHRGLTWSCQDDVVLREKYSRFPSKKSVKGLKLILLDNSHYGTLN